MQKFLLIALMFLIPLAGGILLALVQRLVYTILLSRGLIAPDRVPPFVILFARGLLVIVILAILFALLTRCAA